MNLCVLRSAKIVNSGIFALTYGSLLYTLSLLQFTILCIMLSTEHELPKEKKVDYSLPFPVQRMLGKLGQDIKNARLRRRISTAIMAERASISRTTLMKLEKGDSGVSIGIFATVLFCLGMSDRLTDLADVQHDLSGIAMEEERLPKRIRRHSK
jgi:DNA-binding XRE family transcriptional regulator